MDLTEAKEILGKISRQEREKLLTNIKRITFDFKINKSFLKYPAHPITIPREFYIFLDIHGIIEKQDATVVFPDGSSALGYIYHGTAGWGEFYQIKIRSSYSGIGIGELKVGDLIKVEIYKVEEKTRIELTRQ